VLIINESWILPVKSHSFEIQFIDTGQLTDIFDIIIISIINISKPNSLNINQFLIKKGAVRRFSKKSLI
jgi:hypothetical protein